MLTLLKNDTGVQFVTLRIDPDTISMLNLNQNAVENVSVTQAFLCNELCVDLANSLKYNYVIQYIRNLG